MSKDRPASSANAVPGVALFKGRAFLWKFPSSLSSGILYSVVMAYAFAENEHELEPLASSARGGGGPPKFTATAVLDPPVPPKRPPGPIPLTPASMIFRIFAGLILAALAAATLFLLFASH